MRTLLSKATKKQVDALLNGMPHAIGITGPEGSGKAYLAQHIKSNIIEDNDESNLLIVRPNDKRKVTIEQARELPKFLQLKTAGAKSKRVIIVEDADTMTTEAQNAILKTIEESPLNTTIIMTFPNSSLVLPTIISRLSIIKVASPALSESINFFRSKYTEDQISKVYSISGGRTGLMTALLENSNHELIDAIQTSKQLLSRSSFDRVKMIEQLSKTDIARVLDALSIVSKAAFSSAVKSDQEQKVVRLAKVRESVSDSIQKSRFLPNNKLLLTDLMLRI